MKRLVITIFVLLFTGVNNAQWTQLTHGINYHFDDISFADSLNGIAVGWGGVYNTSDGGYTWQKVADWELIWPSYTSVEFVNSNIGWVTSFNAVGQGYFFKTVDKGKTWTKVDNGTVDGRAHKTFWINDQLGFACGATQGIWNSNDTTGTNAGLFWKTTNGGQTWTHKSVAKPSSGGWHNMWMSPNGKGWLITPKLLYVTTDMGETWEKSNFQTHSPQEFFRSIYFFDADNGLMFNDQIDWDGIRSENVWIYKTSDGGNTWQLIMEMPGYTTALVKPYCVIDSLNVVLTRVDLTNYVGQIIRSIDGCKTWKVEYTYPWGTEGIGTVKRLGRIYWAAGTSVWRSDNTSPIFVSSVSNSIAYVDSDYCQQLQVIDPDGDRVTLSIIAGPTFLTIKNLTISGVPTSTDIGNYIVKILATDGRGGSDTLSYNLHVDKTTGVEVIEGIPTEYTLNQNYPNPFNPSTTISFSIPTSELVTLKVYDVLGREIATIVNDYKNAGSYIVNFDASKFSSGTYIYRIQAGEFSASKKMILLK